MHVKVKNLPPDDLLGYVLGALDADQQNALQNKLDDEPRLEERLLDIKASLIPLELLSDPGGGRPGLARRTCELVATIQNESDETATSTQRSRNWLSPAFSLASPGSWSVRDFAMTTLALAVLLGVLLPVVAYSRHQARLVHCQDNLRSLGAALASYSESNEGRYIDIPDSGPLAFAGLFGPKLKEAGYVEDNRLFACAGVSRDEPLEIPTCEQITLCSAGPEYDRFRRMAGGDYGYSLGYTHLGTFCASQRRARLPGPDG